MFVTHLTAGDGTELALHAWEAGDHTPVIFYVHGMQSHAGWLFEAGPALVQRGVSLYALDRRGSGISGGMRGHLPSDDTVLDDYQLACEWVRSRTDPRPLVGMGQSFGANLFASLLVSRPVEFDALVFCTPAIGHQRARYDEAELAERRVRSGTELHAVPLIDEQYSDIPQYRQFMADDGRMLRKVTSQTQSVRVRLEDRYVHAAEADQRLAAPVHVVFAAGDPIINAPMVRKIVSLLAPGFTETTFATNSHYLDFTDQAQPFWDWMAQVARSATAEPRRD